MSDRIDTLRNILSQIENAINQMRHELDDLDKVWRMPDGIELNTLHKVTRTQAASRDSLPPPRRLALHQINVKTPLSTSEQAILSAIAWLEEAKPIEMHRTLISSLAGYSPTERSFYEALNSLTAQDLILTTGHTIKLTVRGSYIAVGERSPLTSEILAQKVAMQLTRLQGGIFRLLFTSRGTGVSRDEIAKKCDRGGDKAFGKDLSTLQHLSLVDRVSNNNYACAEMLFLD
jgi:hypothetical protein